MHPRIILAGGGGADDSKLLDEQFAKWTKPGGRMLYLPVAMDGTKRSYASCLDWFTSVFRPLGIDEIEMWTELHGRTMTDLSCFASVYLGGGNTFRLLDRMRASGFDKSIKGFLHSGGVVYGGSAGAIVMGRDIRTCEHLDSNDARLVDSRGLDLVNGYAVWCHYKAEDDLRIAAFIESHRTPVLALSERTGVCLEEGRLIPIGFEPVHCFTFQRRNAFKIGENIPV